MNYIISIETATPTCSIALHNSGNLVALKELHVEKSHAEMLTIMIRDLIAESGILFKELKAIAISRGPGSYTGLRIGTSTAKGLCFSLDIPLIAVNTLYSMAQHMIKYNVHQYLLAPLLDARRMEVYGLITDHQLQPIMNTSAVIIQEDSFKDIIDNHRIIFFGSGAIKCKPVLGKHSHTFFIDRIHPSASSLGELAYQKYLQQEFEDLAYFTPNYLKEFHTHKPKRLN